MICMETESDAESKLYALPATTLQSRRNEAYSS